MPDMPQNVANPLIREAKTATNGVQKHMIFHLISIDETSNILYIQYMLTKSEIKRKIKENAHLLKEYHVSRIGIFGSYINGNPSEKSDIDLLVDFSETISLFEYVHLSDSLTSFLNQKVDLVTVDGIKPGIQNTIINQVEWIEEKSGA